jgi:hypothetical protein
MKGVSQRRDVIGAKRYSEATGKLHIPCPHRERTGISIHVVVRDGCCYRSGQCLVFECKFHEFQNDLEKILSVTW